MDTISKITVLSVKIVNRFDIYVTVVPCCVTFNLPLCACRRIMTNQTPVCSVGHFSLALCCPLAEMNGAPSEENET
jgi:hypothetical protein